MLAQGAVLAGKGLRKGSGVKAAGVGGHGQSPVQLRSACCTIAACADSLRIPGLRATSA